MLYTIEIVTIYTKFDLTLDFDRFYFEKELFSFSFILTKGVTRCRAAIVLYCVELFLLRIFFDLQWQVYL